MAEEAIDTNAGNGSSGTQHEAVGKRPGPKSRAFARGFWLVTAGVVLFLIGVATMRRLDVHAQQDQVELRHSAREEREAKLREAIDAWAVQEAVRLHAQEHDPKAVTKSLEVLRQEAMARLGVHNAALEGPTPNFGSYWKAPKTRFHVFIDEILEKAGAGLVIAAILLIIAGVVVPVYTLCSEAAGKIVDKISELPEPRASSPVAVTTLAIASTARMATTGAVARN